MRSCFKAEIAFIHRMVRIPLDARNFPVLHMNLQPATAMAEPAYGSKNLVRHDVLELPLRDFFMLRCPKPLPLSEEGHSFLGIRFRKMQTQNITYFGLSQLSFYQETSPENQNVFFLIPWRG